MIIAAAQHNRMQEHITKLQRVTVLSYLKMYCIYLAMIPPPLSQYEYTILRNQYLQGSHPTWITWNFIIYFSSPGKCLEFAPKVRKTWNFNSKPGKKFN